MAKQHKARGAKSVHKGKKRGMSLPPASMGPPMSAPAGPTPGPNEFSAADEQAMRAPPPMAGPGPGGPPPDEDMGGMA